MLLGFLSSFGRIDEMNEVYSDMSKKRDQYRLNASAFTLFSLTPGAFFDPVKFFQHGQ